MPFFKPPCPEPSDPHRHYKTSLASESGMIKGEADEAQSPASVGAVSITTFYHQISILDQNPTTAAVTSGKPFPLSGTRYRCSPGWWR
jgi:hypothetical protein